jgi:hypothetical protein
MVVIFWNKIFKRHSLLGQFKMCAVQQVMAGVAISVQEMF